MSNTSRMSKIQCTATGILDLEEWTHAGKLAAISRRTKKMWAYGLEGRRTKINQAAEPSTFIPYDAGMASEGTQEIPTHGIPLPRHSPGPALSVDSAAALTPIIDDVEEKLRR
jgi:hypothetical protein